MMLTILHPLLFTLPDESPCLRWTFFIYVDLITHNLHSVLVRGRRNNKWQTAPWRNRCGKLLSTLGLRANLFGTRIHQLSLSSSQHRSSCYLCYDYRKVSGTREKQQRQKQQSTAPNSTRSAPPCSSPASLHKAKAVTVPIKQSHNYHDNNKQTEGGVQWLQLFPHFFQQAFVAALLIVLTASS